MALDRRNKDISLLGISGFLSSSLLGRYRFSNLFPRLQTSACILVLCCKMLIEQHHSSVLTAGSGIGQPSVITALTEQRQQAEVRGRCLQMPKAASQSWAMLRRLVDWCRLHVIQGTQCANQHCKRAASLLEACLLFLPSLA